MRSTLNRLRDLARLSDLRNINIYYLLVAVSNAAFISGNWIFFWTRFAEYGQLGLLDASVFAYGIVMEVPTGAVADMVGKRYTLLLATVFGFIGFMVMGSTQTFLQLALGFVLFETGTAFFTGAVEALAYETLKEHDRAGEFERVVTLGNSIGMVSSVVAILSGAWLYNVLDRLPHYAWGIAYLVGMVGAWFIIEPKTETVKFTFRVYAEQLLTGVRQLAKPRLRHYLPLMLAVLGAHFFFVNGILQPAVATSFGFDATAQGIINAGLGVLSVFAIALIPRWRRGVSDTRGMMLLAAALMIGYLASSWALGAWGIVVLFLIRMVGGLAIPWTSIIVNHEIDSRYRATTLSTVALISKIPYVLTGMIAGKMIESGTYNLFSYAVVGVIVLMMLLSAWMDRRTRSRVSAEDEVDDLAITPSGHRLAPHPLD